MYTGMSCQKAETYMSIMFVDSNSSTVFRVYHLGSSRTSVNNISVGVYANPHDTPCDELTSCQ